MSDSGKLGRRDMRGALGCHDAGSAAKPGGRPFRPHSVQSSWYSAFILAATSSGSALSSAHRV
jgi:hypothetical protein